MALLSTPISFFAFELEYAVTSLPLSSETRISTDEHPTYWSRRATVPLDDGVSARVIVNRVETGFEFRLVFGPDADILAEPVGDAIAQGKHDDANGDEREREEREDRDCRDQDRGDERGNQR